MDNINNLLAELNTKYQKLEFYVCTNGTFYTFVVNDLTLAGVAEGTSSGCIYMFTHKALPHVEANIIRYKEGLDETN